MRGIGCLLLFLLLCCSQINAQVDVFAQAKLDRRTVYPQQPIKVSITVYTQTWFTKPLDIESIQVPNAFVLPFKRTLSAMRKVDGKQYASLEFFYLIYPYQSGTYMFPEIRVGVESPPVGDYKGVPIQVKTAALSFDVIDKPSEFEGAEWFVAKDVLFSEEWNKPLDQLKVGDVVERSITINARGTLPNFIPDLAIQEEEYANLYKQSPRIEDKRTSQTVNGIKTETFLYLLKASGTFNIPEVRVDWWNPYAARAYFKTIPARTITISENPDLGMLTTLQDSLSNVSNIQNLDVSTTKWWTEKRKNNSILVVIVLVSLFILSRFIKVVIRRLRDRRTTYKNSEDYAFRQIKNKSGRALDLAIHNWWSKFYIIYGLSPSLAHELSIRRLNNATSFKELKSFRTQVKAVNDLSTQHFSSLQAIK